MQMSCLIVIETVRWQLGGNLWVWMIMSVWDICPRKMLVKLTVDKVAETRWQTVRPRCNGNAGSVGNHIWQFFEHNSFEWFSICLLRLGWATRYHCEWSGDCRPLNYSTELMNIWWSSESWNWIWLLISIQSTDLWIKYARGRTTMVIIRALDIRRWLKRWVTAFPFVGSFCVTFHFPKCPFGKAISNEWLPSGSPMPLQQAQAPSVMRLTSVPSSWLLLEFFSSFVSSIHSSNSWKILFEFAIQCGSLDRCSSLWPTIRISQRSTIHHLRLIKFSFTTNDESY